MEEKTIDKYIENDELNIEKVINEYSGYIYIIVKNLAKETISKEDIEEIISDVFIAVWNNSKEISNTIDIKAYLAGTAKNIIKNKYRKNEINFSISEYEEKIVDNSNLEKQAEENEQNIIIKNTLKTLKKEEYTVFIMFYYENRTTKEIA